MQQGSLADVTKHVNSPVHLPERSGRSSDKNAQSHNMLSDMGPFNSVLSI